MIINIGLTCTFIFVMHVKGGKGFREAVLLNIEDVSDISASNIMHLLPLGPTYNNPVERIFLKSSIKVEHISEVTCVCVCRCCQQCPGHMT